jgi:hypothetical protein
MIVTEQTLAWPWGLLWAEHMWSNPLAAKLTLGDFMIFGSP